MNTFDSIMDHIQAGIVIIKEDGHEIIYLNRKAEEMIGCKKDNIIGKVCHEFICSAKYGECPITDLNQTVDNSERVLLTWKGETIPILKTVTRASIDGQKCIIDTFLDLTEQKKQDENIRKNEENLRDLFDNASALIQQVDVDGNIIKVNKTWCQKLGYSEKEAFELNVRDIIHRDYYDFCMKKFKALQHGNNFSGIETVFVRKDGSGIEVMGSINGRFVNEKFVHSQGIFHDITARKEIENVLMESERKLRTITDSARDAIIQMNDTGEINFWNPGAEKVFGYSKEEIMGKNLHEILAPERYHEAQREGFAKFIETGKGAAVGQILELSGLHKDGREIFVELSISSVKIKGKWNAIAVIRDVTGRRQMEREIKYTRDKYLALVENSPEGIIVIQDAKLAFVNRTSEELLGFSPDELVGKSFTDLVIPEDMDLVVERYRKRMAGEEVPDAYELQLMKKDGQYIPTDVFATKIDYDGRPADLVFIRDITDRKKTETALQENEEKYRLITESSTDFISKLDLDGNFVYVSPSHNRLGYTEEELLGTSAFDYVHSDDVESMMKIFLEKLQNPNDMDSVTLDFRFRGSEGEWHDLESRGNFIFNEDGEAKSILLISRNVTDRKFMENELRESEERYHSLITQSIDGITLTDTDGTILEWNPGMEDFTGISGGEARGASIWEIMSRLMPPGAKDTEIIERMKMGLMSSMADPDGEHWGKLMNFRFYNAVENRFIDVQAMNFPIQTDDGIRAASMMRDVSEIRKMELAMSGIMKKLEEKNQELEDYTYTVSHDLKAPLVTIQGFSELLTSQYSDKLDDKAKHYLDRINQGSENLARLVTDLLELSRAGRKTREFEEHDFNDIVQISTDALEGRLAEREIKLSYPDDFPVVQGDDVRLTQVMSNLIGNAVNYMGDQEKPEINIGWKRDGDNYVIWVEDNGIGIRKEDMGRIFKTFERASEGENGGTGIGLSIVKKVIQTHGGEIHVESEPGKGSKFIFTLPVEGEKSWN